MKEGWYILFILSFYYLLFLNIFVLKNKDMPLKIDKVTLQFEIKPNYDANYSSIIFFAKKLWNNVVEKLVKFNFFLYLCTSK